MESVGGTHGVDDSAPVISVPERDGHNQHERKEGGDNAVMMRRDPSSSSESPIDDDLERGDAYELQPRSSVRRRSTISRAE